MIECPVDTLVPIPTEGTLPYKTVRERAAVACYAGMLLEKEGYNGVDMPINEALNAAKHIVTSVAHGVEPTGSYVPKAFSMPTGAMTVNTILQEFDMEIVQDAKRIRNYVTNRLIIESENNDPRVRMRALEMLGKISDVGLFTDRSEVTVTNRSTTDLQDVLKSKLKKLMLAERVDDAEDIVVVQPPTLKQDFQINDL